MSRAFSFLLFFHLFTPQFAAPYATRSSKKSRSFEELSSVTTVSSGISSETDSPGHKRLKCDSQLKESSIHGFNELEMDSFDINLNILNAEENKENIEISDLTLSSDSEEDDLVLAGKSVISGGTTWDSNEVSLHFPMTVVEMNQIKASRKYTQFADIKNNLVSDLFDGRYRFNLPWPGNSLQTISALSAAFHAYSLKIILTEGHEKLLNFMIRANLIEWSIPVYDNHDGVYRSLLLMAVETATLNRRIAARLIKAAPNIIINQPSSKGILPLTAAILKGETYLIDKLVGSGANITVNDSLFVKSPLLTAISMDRIDIILQLCKSPDFDPNFNLQTTLNIIICITNSLGFKLSTSAYKSLKLHDLTYVSMQIICLLLYRKDISRLQQFILPCYQNNHPHIRQIISDLIYLSHMGAREEVIKFFRNIGFKYQNQTTETAYLMIDAVRSGNFILVKYFLELGIDPNSKCSKSGISALISASKNGHINIVKLLIESGAKKE